MVTAKNQITAAEFRYKHDFDELVRIHRENVKTGSQVFIRKYYNPTDDPKHKLTPILTGTYQVTGFDDKKCVISLDKNI